MIPAITVIGCDGGPLRDPALAALADARCVAGARRWLAAYELPAGADRIEIGGNPPASWPGSSSASSLGSSSASSLGAFGAALSAIVSHPGPVAVLASGDPGFFGIVRAFTERGIAPSVVPAPSSVALAFARLGLPWDDALVLSAHGRDPRPVLAAALGCAKAAILTAPGQFAGPRRFITPLIEAGRLVYVAERLGAPDERLTQLPFDGRAPGRPEQTPEFADPNLVIALDPSPAPGACGGPRWMAGHLGAPDGWALAEDAFDHRDSMITKAEVRALVLARLGPGPGRTIWDVGAGSGSVAVECARFGAHVIAVESDPEQCARIRANAAAHRVRVGIAEGRAPGALRGLLAADAVFVGGGDDAVLGAVAAAAPGRIVAALASVDRIRTVRDLLRDHGYVVAGTALQASRLAPLPCGSVRLAAANPVFVLCGDRR